MDIKDQIRATFTDKTIYANRIAVKGSTVRELKTQLRGVVYQDQKKFVDQITHLGFKMQYSVDSSTWIIYE